MENLLSIYIYIYLYIILYIYIVHLWPSKSKKPCWVRLWSFRMTQVFGVSRNLGCNDTCWKQDGNFQKLVSQENRFAGLVSVWKSVLLFNGYPLLLSFSCLLETGEKRWKTCLHLFCHLQFILSVCCLTSAFDRCSCALPYLKITHAMECNSLESCLNHTKYKVNMSISILSAHFSN